MKYPLSAKSREKLLLPLQGQVEISLCPLKLRNELTVADL